MYFIRDCNNNIVGNPKGYATFRGAVKQQDTPGTPAYRAIWSAYDTRAAQERADHVPFNIRSTNICSIRLQDTE